MMKDYQDRVRNEKNELDAKIYRLADFMLSNIIYTKLHIDEKDRLNLQHSIMKIYSEILRQRIAAFEV